MVYSSIAPLYDAIMWHVDYQEWVSLIKKVLYKYSSKKSISIFEIGSGTGSLAKAFTSSSSNFICSDINYDMIRFAKKKKFPSVCADARNLPVKKTFDLILFLYDGINYLHSLNEYKKVFSSVASILPNGGLFLFDITTETNSKRYFNDFVSCEELDGSTVVRHSYYNDKKKLQFNDFTIFSPDMTNTGLFTKTEEQHVQKIFYPTQIESAIPKKLFKLIGIWDNYSMLKYNKNSERIHFLLQKIN